MDRPSRLLTTRQLAGALGVSESSIKRWVDDGRIYAERTAGGHRRIPVGAAVAFMRSQGGKVVDPSVLGLGAPPDVGGIDQATRDAVSEALAADDAGRYRSLVTGRYLAGASISTVGDHLIWPALSSVLGGTGSPGPAAIAHRAVDASVEVLAQLGSWVAEPGDDAPTAITAASEGDRGVVLPLLASMVLREQGVRAKNLGSLTPIPTVQEAAERYGARVCILAMSESRGECEVEWGRLAESLGSEGGCVLAVGPGADALSDEIRSVVSVCESMNQVGERVGEMLATPAS